MSLATRLSDFATRVGQAFADQRRDPVVLDGYESQYFAAGAAFTIDATTLGTGSFNAGALGYRGQVVAVLWVPDADDTTAREAIQAANPNWDLLDSTGFAGTSPFMAVFVQSGPVSTVTLSFPGWAGAGLLSVYAVSNADRAAPVDLYSSFDIQSRSVHASIQQNTLNGAAFAYLEQGGLLLHQLMADSVKTFTPHTPVGAELALPGTTVSLGALSSATASTQAWSTPITATRQQAIGPKASATVTNLSMVALVFRRAYIHKHALTDVNITGILPIAQVPVAPSGTSSATQVVRADDSRLSDSRRNTTVRTLGTGNEALSGLRTIWGVAMVAGDRILLINQTTPSQNGIYTVASGAWTRATDANTIDDFLGMSVIVEEGTWATVHLRNRVKATDVLGTTAQTWVWSLDDGLYNIANGIPRLDGGGLVQSAQMPTRLGAAPPVVTASYDTLIESGWYYMDATAAQRPTGADACYLEVRRSGSNNVEQVARTISKGQEYKRYMTAGSWGAWVGDTEAVPSRGSGVNAAGIGPFVYRRGPMATISMELVIPGTVAAGAAILTVTNAYYPIRRFYFYGTAGRQFYISTDGTVKCTAAITASAIDASHTYPAA